MYLKDMSILLLHKVMEVKIVCLFVSIGFLEMVTGLFITNAPIFLSNISPILYHEACFSDHACLHRSFDGVPYVSCEECVGGRGTEISLSSCNVISKKVEFNLNCTLYGGFCASVTDNRSVCVPAVPFDDAWWPEAVPSSLQNCRAKCGVDRAYFKYWDKDGGYDKTCLCPAENENNAPTNSINPPTIYDDYDVRRLLYRDPFPFCYFEQCNHIFDYRSRFSRQNFTGVHVKKRSDALVVTFESRKDETNSACLKRNIHFPYILKENDSDCWEPDSVLFLFPQHLPDLYYERKKRTPN